MKLYKFYWHCGRMGHVEGVFAAEPGAVESAVGKAVYFGEILGKFSEVNGTLEEKDLTVIDEGKEFVTRFNELFPAGVGYNPLHYILEYCEECGVEMDIDINGELRPCWSCVNE